MEATVSVQEEIVKLELALHGLRKKLDKINREAKPSASAAAGSSERAPGCTRQAQP